MKNFEYNGTNWLEFLYLYWNKKPVLIKNMHSEYHLTSEELYNSVTKSCADFKSGSQSTIKLYVSNKLITQDLYDSLPSESSQHFATYASVIKQKYDSETFTLYVNDENKLLCLKFNPFLQAIGDAFQVKFQKVDFEVFAGRYKSTAGGVHQEDCSNFHFLVHGKKSMRIWHPEVFDGNAFPIKQINSERYLTFSDYEPYLNKSILLQGEAGDVLYWPASFWHVGESPMLSASVNLAMYMQ